jgi:hypothetical protein
VDITKERLSKLDPETRTLLFLLGHACNEIMVLQKILHAMPRSPHKSELVNMADMGQAFIVMRLLAGKLHEAWELVKKRVQPRRAVPHKYLSNVSPKGARALRRLNTHFGKKSPITDIRNNLAFHNYD